MLGLQGTAYCMSLKTNVQKSFLKQFKNKTKQKNPFSIGVPKRHLLRSPLKAIR